MASKCSRTAYVFAVVLTVLVWIACLVVGGVYMRDGSRTEDLGKDIVGHQKNNSLQRRTDRTDYAPASWAFSIWFVIYFWQAVCLLYCVLSMFPRFNLCRVPLLCFPFYNLANIGGAGWTVCDHYDFYWPGVGAIAAMPLALYISLILSIHHLYRRDCKYYLYTYMVHNAWAIYAGWVSVATLLYIGMSMIHAGPDMETQLTGTIMLSVLAFELLVFCGLEHSVLEKFMRHIWGHYISLAVAIVGSIMKNWDPENRNSILTVAIAGFLTCSACVKVMKILSEKCARPDIPNIKEHDSPEMSDNEKKYLE